MKIIIDDLTGEAIKFLLEEHLQKMKANTPPESMHALNIDALRATDITFWSAWDADELLGCAALKERNTQQGELKTMRTASSHLRKGVAKILLNHVLEVAQQRNYQTLNLETGAGKDFLPARKLYTKAGFIICAPFDKYTEDPNSVFMTKNLTGKSHHV